MEHGNRNTMKRLISIMIMTVQFKDRWISVKMDSIFQKDLQTSMKMLQVIKACYTLANPH